MPSQIEIVNMALSHIGVGPVSDLEEWSEAAEAANQFFETAKGMVLRDFPWPFATRVATLAPVANTSTEWSYCYRYPDGCAFFKRIQSGVRVDTRKSRVKFRIHGDANGKLIYTDQPSAVGEYTAKVADLAKADDDFAMALSLRLAAFMAPRIAEKEPFKLRTFALNLYNLEIERAWANAANEETLDIEPDSSYIRARGEGSVDNHDRPTWPTNG